MFTSQHGEYLSEYKPANLNNLNLSKKRHTTIYIAKQDTSADEDPILRLQSNCTLIIFKLTLLLNKIHSI